MFSPAKWMMAMATAAAIAAPSLAVAADYPEDRIKFVIPFAPGGGSDAVALRIVKIAAKYTDKPIDLLYMPGGAGVIGAKHVADADKNPPLPMLVALSEFITAPPPEAGYVAEDFEWINELTVYGIGAVVQPGSELTLKDLLDKAKNEPGSVSLGSLVGGGSEIIAKQFEEVYGAKFKVVPFSSNGETMLAVLGGHIDMALVSSGGAIEAQTAGTAKVIAISLPERLASFPEIPTMTEVLGTKMVFGIDRAIFGQKGMDPEAKAFIEDLFEKIVKDPDFVKETSEKGELPNYLEGAEFKTYLDGQLAMLRPMFKKTDQ
jgi:tripartite-type tricarboxylate transporter receptor subunit TctC